MKVFLSWSGEVSHKIARIFREWLPSVVQSLQPYVSSEDIDKGARWSTDIAKELEASAFGIIFVTPENLEAPWVNFEAGALSKSLDKSNVSPFLFSVKRSEVHGPLLQFQSTVFEKEDVEKLVKSLNNRLDDKEKLKPEQLEKSFRVWWPELEKQLKEIKQPAGEQESGKGKAKPQSSEILEQILELARQQQRLINDPMRLLPPDYVQFVLREFGSGGDSAERYERLHLLVIELEAFINSQCAEHPNLAPAIDLIAKIHHDLHRVGRRAVRGKGMFPEEVKRVRKAVT